MVPEIQPSEVHERQLQLQQSGGILLIDVREEDEFLALSSPYAKLFPLSTLAVQDVLDALNLDINTDQVPLYFICASGNRSRRAAEMFQEAGYQAVYNVAGGMNRWRDCSLPLR